MGFVPTMFEQAWHWIGQTQFGVMRALSTALRDGSATTFALAFALGALHALTPGHGKAALTAYMLAKPSSVGKGIRIALSAASLHVLSGLVAFVVMRFLLKQVPLMTGRGPASITILGAGFVIAAGAMMVWQSVRPHTHTHDGAHALTIGMGLLPCPLTISVLGFAWLQSSVVTLLILVISLASGIALTIGIVAVGAALAQRVFGLALADRLDAMVHGATVLQAVFGAVMIGLGAYMIRSLT